MVQKELEWVKSNVKNQSDDVATGLRDIDDCQPFVMTAPGPGQVGNMNQQREPSRFPFFFFWFLLSFPDFLF